MSGDSGGSTSGGIGAIGTGLQIAGIFGSASAAYKKSTLEKTGYEFQSKVAANNAIIAEQQAGDAITRGQTNENTVRQNTAQLKSTQVASLAARNLDMGSGSPLDILTSTDYMGEVDALKVRNNATKEAWGDRVNAQSATDASRMLSWRSEQQSPTQDAFSTLLTGAGTVASSWYAMRNRTGTSNTGIS